MNATCLDWQKQVIPSGRSYAPSNDPCRTCMCEGGVPHQCVSVHCKPPPCSYRKVPGKCCEFSCLGELMNASGDIPPGRYNPGVTYVTDVSSDDPTGANLGLRMIAAAITLCLLLGVTLFLIHVTKRKRRMNRLCRQQALALGACPLPDPNYPLDQPERFPLANGTAWSPLVFPLPMVPPPYTPPSPKSPCEPPPPYSPSIEGPVGAPSFVYSLRNQRPSLGASIYATIATTSVSQSPGLYDVTNEDEIVLITHPTPATSPTPDTSSPIQEVVHTPEEPDETMNPTSSDRQESLLLADSRESSPNQNTSELGVFVNYGAPMSSSVVTLS